MYKNLIVLPDGSELASGAVGADAIRRLTLTENINAEQDLCPGTAAAACLEFEVWAQPGGALRITAGDELRYFRVGQDGIRTLVGRFLADKPTRASANTYKITAYDRMVLADKDLSPWLRTHQKEFPLNLWVFACQVAVQCGLAIAGSGLPHNNDYLVQAFYADGLTGRQLLAWVAQASATFCRVTPQGYLRFDWYRDFGGRFCIAPRASGGGEYLLAAQPDGAMLLDSAGQLLDLAREGGAGIAAYQGSLHYEDYQTAPLDKVQIRQSDNDVGVIWPEDASGTNALVIQGNLLLMTASDTALRAVAAELYRALADICYTPCRVRVFGGASIPVGSILRVEDARGHTFKSCIMSVQSSAGAATLQSTGNARRDGSSTANRQSWRNLQGRMLEIVTTVDGLRVKASELDGKYAELRLEVNHFGVELSDTKAELYSAIDQTVGSIKLEVSNKGSTSTLTLRAGDAVLSSTNVVITGFVTFNSLSTKGQTTINGGNITTGTITSSNGQLRIGVDSGTVEVGSDSGNYTKFVASGLEWYTGAEKTGAIDNTRTVAQGSGTPKPATMLYTRNAAVVIGYQDAAGAWQGGYIYDPWMQVRDGYQNSFNGAVWTQSTSSAYTLRARNAMYLQNRQGGAQDALLYATTAGGNSVLWMAGAEGGELGIRCGGGLYASGLTIADNGSKYKAVRTAHYGIRGMEAVESAIPLFADNGSGVLDEGGVCWLELHPIFAETLESTAAPQWHITANAPGVWVEKHGATAIVHGSPGTAFDWLCLAPQRGWSASYADPVEMDADEYADTRDPLLDRELDAQAGAVIGLETQALDLVAGEINRYEEMEETA